MTVVINLDVDTDFSLAIDFLQDNKIIGFPTDTVYGIGALLGSREGIQKLYYAKARSQQKAIAVLVGDVSQLGLVAKSLPNHAVKLAARFWPGAITLVLPKNDHLPENISQGPTIGVRMPDHPLILKLLKMTGPLATTSANLSGGKDPVDAQEVLNQLGDKIDLLFDGGVSPGGIPSTVVDCTITPPVILRQGAIPASEVFSCIEND